jgi:hypothetical protein
MSSEDLIRSSVANNTYAPEVMSRASKDELSIVGDYAVNNGSGLTIDQRQTFINNASGTLSDPQLARQLGKNKAVIEAIRGVDGGTIRSIKNG